MMVLRRSFAGLLLFCLPVVSLAQGPPAVSLSDPLYGGVPEGRSTGTVIPLSLADAISRGLKHNLAGILGELGIQRAEAARLRTRSLLLPNLSIGASESLQQVNLAALGFRGFPGVPMVVGPFSVVDTRLYLTQTLFDLKTIQDLKSGEARRDAAESAQRNLRDRVVLVCGDLYLQIVAARSRVEAVRSQVESAQSLLDLAADRKQAGVAPGIEVLRAQVELQTQQQRLIQAENDLATAKLGLARAIGLPPAQEFDPADAIPYAKPPGMSPQEAVERAYRDRADLQAALAGLRAAELSRKAAAAERMPSLKVSANYGVNGPSPGHSHGSFALVAGIRIPIFEGGGTEARILEADLEVRQQQAAVEDLKSRIYYEVQTSFLNMKAADDRIRVAESSVKLAREQLAQAEDRFGAGVASNIEVVQAQEAVASASDSHISSLYAHTLAKGRLALAVGMAEKAWLQFLRGVQ